MSFRRELHYGTVDEVDRLQITGDHGGFRLDKNQNQRRSSFSECPS